MMHHPPADFVHQRALNSSVKSSYPTLKMQLRFPKADNVLAIFVKLHLQTMRIMPRACETLKTFNVNPWIFKLPHKTIFYFSKKGSPKHWQALY
jgi:hypothetical protein